MINLKNIYLTFEHKVVFNHITCGLPVGKIGLFGRNGMGKSTLLRAISGTQPLDEGSIIVPNNFRIAYMPQNITFTSTKTTFDEAFDACTPVRLLELRKEEIEKIFEQPTAYSMQPHLLQEYEDIITQLRHYNRYALIERVTIVLTGLGFSEKLQHQAIGELSVGMKMRLVLAQLLLQDADFYLFDEPTNHLDMVSIGWFTNFLHTVNGFLLATHDRHLLETTCDYIFELENGSGTLYTGNFSTYLVQKQEREAVKKNAYERQQRYISHTQEWIAKYKAKATKARQAHSVQKKLDRLERITLDSEPNNITMHIPTPPRSAHIVVSLERVSFAYETIPIICQVSEQLYRGQKIGIVAPNGTGKTTLLHLIAGHLKPQHGKIIRGEHVAPGFFEQDQATVLNPEHTIIQELTTNNPQNSALTIRSLLGAFLFSGDDVHKKIAVLSGGEKNRVGMVNLLLKTANFLMLDEPTNHLDIFSKEILLNALQKYTGTILFVSHDFEFINNLATDIWELSQSYLYTYHGSYEMYLWTKQQKSLLPNGAVSHLQKKEPKKVTSSLAQEKRIKQLEREITQLEHTIARIGIQLSETFYGSGDYVSLKTQLQEYSEKLTNLMNEWESLQG